MSEMINELNDEEKKLFAEEIDVLVNKLSILITKELKEWPDLIWKWIVEDKSITSFDVFNCLLKRHAEKVIMESKTELREILENV